MALNFIKKVFSFGRGKEATPDPAPDPAAEPERKPEAKPVPVSQDAAPLETPPEIAPGAVRTEKATAPEDLSADPAAFPAPAEAREETRDEAPEEASDETLHEPLTPAGGDTGPIQAFPHDAAQQFTPETADNNALSTPAPADKEHSGEPPIQTAPEDEAAVVEPVIESAPEADEGVAPENLAADPAVEPEPRRLIVRDRVSNAEPAIAAEPVQEERGSWWSRLRQGLSRTSGQLTGQISGIFTKRRLDEDTLQDLEDVLLQADLGVETAMRITDALSASRYGRDISPAEVQKVMADEIAKALAPVARPLELDLSHKPHVILVVGVNGTGKTTTIGKLAAKLSAGGLKVTLAAGDTFRAAAIEQLKIWGERTGSKVVSTKLGADAAGLAYEAFETARADGADVLIIDTAGRLQNRTELMDELAKVVRVIGKLDPDAPHTVLQTLDATTGQNALNQVEIFKNVAGVNGLVMTKLDGTARGGILVAIAARHKLPVYFVGVGEGIDDLEPFEAADFASAIAGEPK